MGDSGERTALRTTPEVHDKKTQGTEQRAPYTLFATHSTLTLQMGIVLDLSYVSCSRTKLLLLHAKVKTE